MNYVYSTLTAENGYPVYKETGSKELDIIDRIVYIQGGANVASKHLVTPKGVVTEVSNEDLELLMKHPAFLQHMENGFITVEKRNTSVEKAVADMSPKDLSAPKTPDDYANSNENVPLPQGVTRKKG